MINEQKENHHQTNADDAIKKINKQLDRSFNVGYKKGFNDGYEKGLEEGKRDAFWNSGNSNYFELSDIIWIIIWIGIVYQACIKK